MQVKGLHIGNKIEGALSCSSWCSPLCPYLLLLCNPFTHSVFDVLSLCYAQGRNGLFLPLPCCIWLFFRIPFLHFLYQHQNTATKTGSLRQKCGTPPYLSLWQRLKVHFSHFKLLIWPCSSLTPFISNSIQQLSAIALPPSHTQTRGVMWVN